MPPQQGSEMKDPKSSATGAPPLVLWLPATEQPQSKGRTPRQKKSEVQVEGHMQPGTDALLARGWLQLQILQQVQHPLYCAQSLGTEIECVTCVEKLRCLCSILCRVFVRSTWQKPVNTAKPSVCLTPPYCDLLIFTLHAIHVNRHSHK